VSATPSGRWGCASANLYATKDTYVSIVLSAGVNLTWLSEQMGAKGACVSEVEQKGFEPSTPTLRTWCSPN
jgi:glucan phosphoethanolaminetransferase (alkaline phosphatase superfamily)